MAATTVDEVNSSLFVKTRCKLNKALSQMVCNSKLHQTLTNLFSSRCQLQVQQSRPDWHRIWLGSPLLSKETARTPWSYWWPLPPSTTMARRALSPPCPHLCSPEPTRLEKRHSKVEMLVLLGIGMCESQYIYIYIYIRILYIYIYIYTRIHPQVIKHGSGKS